MKKFFALLSAFLAVFGLFAFAGCTPAKAQTRSVVCTIFAEYDWVRTVLGEHADRFSLTLLQDAGTDMHSYQPTVADIAAVSESDLFIYVGGESDTWVDGALQNSRNEEQSVLCLFDALGDLVLAEEELEGAEEEHDHGHGEGEKDEHVWLSLTNAQVCVREIAERLSAIDEEYAESYAANAEAYCKQLDKLDGRYRQTVEEAAYDTVLFGDRFPFLYMMKDYGLHYYAAFSGCSAESEASFATIVFLANKLDELGMPAILTIEGSAADIAATVRGNTKSKDQAILTMDSLQSVTEQDIEDGAAYLAAMEENLAVLAQALGA